MNTGMERAAAAQFVDAAFRGLLKRSPDPASLEAYVVQLETGLVTQEQLLAFFASLNDFYSMASPQDRRQAIARLYSPYPQWPFGDPFRWSTTLENVVIFHVPKTGGISLLRLLSEFFHPLQVDGVRAPNQQGVGYTKLFSGHRSWSQFTSIPEPRFSICGLRNPRSRLESLFWFLRSIQKTAEAPYDTAATAAAFAPEDFFRPSNHSIRNVVDNVYVRVFSGCFADENHDPLRQDPAGNIKLAVKRALSLSCLFFLEEVDRSGGQLPLRVSEALSALLGESVPRSLPRENVGVRQSEVTPCKSEDLDHLTELDSEFCEQIKIELGIDI